MKYFIIDILNKEERERVHPYQHQVNLVYATIWAAAESMGIKVIHLDGNYNQEVMDCMGNPLEWTLIPWTTVTPKKSMGMTKEDWKNWFKDQMNQN